MRPSADRAPERANQAQHKAEDARTTEQGRHAHQREMRTDAHAARVHEDPARAHELAIRLSEEHTADLEHEWSQAGQGFEEEVHDEPETDA